MDEKTLSILEYPKVLARLTEYAAFSASRELAQSLKPTRSLEEARRRQAVTREAVHLLSMNDTAGIGGATDIRPLADLAGRGGVLSPVELLSVKNTLIAARELSRVFGHTGSVYPLLEKIAEPLNPSLGLVDAISRCISERGEVLDSASDKLSTVRREVKLAHDRLMSKLDRILNDSHTAPMLQEGIVTQRNGRYVIPLRADYKGRIKAIVHDQSSSGATLFVEPLATVELNNHWQEQILEEQEEERRILAELSAQVGVNSDALCYVVESLAEIDFAFMRAKYARDIRGVEPELVSFAQGQPGNHPGSAVRLHQARHPLLDPTEAVPIDLVLDEKTYALVITGPNTGGKTVSLKTLGLLVLMAQSGLHLPVQSGSTISVFPKIFADIGDEQSIEQSLSTFSGHIRNIVQILKRADRASLVLLDELGAGTDPQEGAALARAILSNLISRGITCLVATHYPELKTYAHTTPGALNASMEFDVKSLRPTYRLNIGLPGRSNALLIAEKIGLPVEIIAEARSSANDNDVRAEDLLDEIHNQRDLARKDREQTDAILAQVENKEKELALRLSGIENERHGILENARQEAEERLSKLEDELAELRRELQRARQPLDALKKTQESVETMQTLVQKPAIRKPEYHRVDSGIVLGEKVYVRSIGMEGAVCGIGAEDVEVQVGSMRIRARRREIERRVDRSPEAPEKKAVTPTRTFSGAGASIAPSPGMEIDLRGQRAEDALAALDRYLESAYLAGMPFVRIIHGKGTGRLRQVLREALRQSPHVVRWEDGLNNEGGDGVTVAHLEID
ncbi:MAG: endonuclease MutS2 [Leptolinea sp.]|nr:endonuclease MutS2 [Leptolinea sp.]